MEHCSGVAYFGAIIKEKSEVSSIYMKSKKWWLVLYVVSFIIIFSPSIFKIDNPIFERVFFSIGGLVLFSSITGLLISAYFNKNEQFNKDSLHIFLCCLLPLVPLLLEMFIPDTYKYLKDFAIFSAVIIIVLSIYFWIIYLWRCNKTIVEIRKDKYLFSIKMIRSMLGAILVFFSATLVIWSLPNEQIIFKIPCQVVNVFVNAMYPFIDMYVYVRSEIDEFDKQEEEKVDEEKKEKLDEQKYEMDKKELQTIKKEIEMMKNEVNRKTAKIEYKITHYKNK